MVDFAQQILTDPRINGDLPPTPRAVLFNGVAPPGRSWPTGAGSPRKWDEQGGYGYTGASLFYIGNGLSEFDVMVDLWEPEHWAKWNSFAPIVEKAPSGSLAKAIELVHPMLNRSPLRITRAVVLDVSQFEQSDNGLFTCRIRLKDFRTVKAIAIGKPDGIPPVSGGSQEAKEDAKLAELEAHREDADRRLNISQKQGLGIFQ